MEVALAEVVGSEEVDHGERPAVDEVDEQAQSALGRDRDEDSADRFGDGARGGFERGLAAHGFEVVVRQVPLLAGLRVADAAGVARLLDEEIRPAVGSADGSHTSRRRARRLLAVALGGVFAFVISSRRVVALG